MTFTIDARAAEEVDGFDADAAWDAAVEPDAPVFEAKAANATRTGAMVALWVPPDVARQLAVDDGEDVDTMHVTLAYLGKADQVDADAALAAVRAAAAQQVDPLAVALTGVARFAEGDDGVPEVYLVDAVGLGALRVTVVAELERRGVDVATNHDFLAHVTRRYLRDDQLDEPMPTAPDVRWEWNELTLALGDEVTTVAFDTAELETKVAHVRTQAGVDKYDLPIGAPILADLPKPHVGVSSALDEWLSPPHGESQEAWTLIPSIEELLADGFDPEAAVKERKRLHHNKTVALIRARQKQEKAGAKLIEVDVAAGPPKKIPLEADAEVIADIALGKQHEQNPKALYDWALNKNGAGASLLWERGKWATLVRHNTGMDAPPIPVVGLTIDDYKIERGLARRITGVTYIVELADGETQKSADARITAAYAAYETVLTSVPAHLRAMQHGVALLHGSNPADDYWAKKFNMPGFKSTATAGHGSAYWWGDNAPMPMLIAHEFGHVVDNGLTGESWFTDLDHPSIEGQPEAWSVAQKRDLETSAAAGGLEFVLTRPGGHAPTLGTLGVTNYGQQTIREDFAESMRLYLKDRREGKLGYLKDMSSDGKASPFLESTVSRMNVRFADLWPLRARTLDAIFGSESTYDTPYHQAQVRRSEEMAYQDARAGAKFHEYRTHMNGFGLSKDEAVTAINAGVNRWEADKKQVAAIEFAKQLSDTYGAIMEAKLTEAMALHKETFGTPMIPEDIEHNVGAIAGDVIADARDTWEAHGATDLDVLNITSLVVQRMGVLEAKASQEWVDYQTEQIIKMEEEKAKNLAVAIEYAAKAKANLASEFHERYKDIIAVDENGDVPMDFDQLGTQLATVDTLVDMMRDEYDPDGSEGVAILLYEISGEYKQKLTQAAVEAQQKYSQMQLEQATAEAVEYQASLADYPKLPADTAKKIRKKKAAVKFYAKKGGATPAAAQAAADEYELAALAEALQELGIVGTPTSLGAKAGGGTSVMTPGIKSGTMTKANKMVKAVSTSGTHPKSAKALQGFGYEGTPGKTKDRLVTELSDRLNNPVDWEIFRLYAAVPKNYSFGGYEPGLGPFEQYTETERLAYIYTDMDRRIATWASTAGDSSTPALCMQHAIKDEFGLKADWGARFLSQGGGHMNAQQLLQDVTQSYPGVSAWFRRVARVMHTHTQETFAEHGVTHVGLHRGMKNMPWKNGEQIRPALQPANSWASNKAIARRFGNKILTATFPVDRILGSCVTGFGCLNEAEFVVFDSDGLADVSGTGYY